MAAPIKQLQFAKFLRKCLIFRHSAVSGPRQVDLYRRLCTSTTNSDEKMTIQSSEKGGFATAFERLEKKIELQQSSNQPQIQEEQDFATMLKNSQLFKLGDVDGRVVVGSIVDIVSDDLYVDFGGKFHCVCKRPKQRGSEYHRGTQVRLKLHDLELTKKFLGSEKHITLLEADATLLGLYKPAQINTTSQ